MSAIDQLFTNLRAANRKAFMPFITAGDPDLEFTTQVLRELAGQGCDMCELGIPYSDPVADGPVIQASYDRALGNCLKLQDIFRAVSEYEPPRSMPIVTMVSYSIIFRHGLDAFATHAKAAGFEGAIVPDLPVEESGRLAEVCRKADLSLIPLITPTTDRDRASRIAELATGFLYYVSVKGVTGERTDLPPELAENVRSLRNVTDLPICIGFGISRPEQVRAIASVADGFIVGSAFVRRFAALPEQSRSDVLKGIGHYAGEMVTAVAAV